MSRIDRYSRVVDHSIPNPTVNDRLLEYFLGGFQNTLMGGYNGTYFEQGSFLRLHNCTSSEEMALSADFGLVMIRHQLLWFQRLGLSSHKI